MTFLPWEKLIWNGRDPVEAWNKVMDAIGYVRDNGELMKTCAEGDEDALAYLQEKLDQVPMSTEDFLSLTDFVVDLRAEYLPWAQAGVKRVDTYRDLCGFWFTRDVDRFKALWIFYRALYLLKWNLPAPAECYPAICGTELEAEELQYDETTDAIDRAHTASH